MAAADDEHVVRLVVHHVGAASVPRLARNNASTESCSVLFIWAVKQLKITGLFIHCNSFSGALFERLEGCRTDWSSRSLTGQRKKPVYGYEALDKRRRLSHALATELGKIATPDDR